MRAPSPSECSFIFATMRASGFMPQSVLSTTRSAGTAASTFLMRAGDRRRRFDGVRPHIEHTHLHRLVLRQVLQELDAVHVAVGVVEHELVDSRRVEEVRQHGLIALRERAADQIVAPCIAEAEVPADVRLHAVTGLGDAVLDPRVVVLVAAEERHPRAEVLESAGTSHRRPPAPSSPR